MREAKQKGSIGSVIRSAKKEAKLVVMAAKIVVFGCLYEERGVKTETRSCTD